MKLKDFFKSQRGGVVYRDVPDMYVLWKEHQLITFYNHTDNMLTINRRIYDYSPMGILPFYPDVDTMFVRFVSEDKITIPPKTTLSIANKHALHNYYLTFDKLTPPPTPPPTPPSPPIEPTPPIEPIKPEKKEIRWTLINTLTVIAIIIIIIIIGYILWKKKIFAKVIT